MPLFLPAYDSVLNCDACVVDSRRAAWPLLLTTEAPSEAVADEILARMVLMGRSVHAVRDLSFALFAAAAGGRFRVAVTAPFEEGVVSVLRDALAAFGAVEAGPDVRLDECDLLPFVGFDSGRVSFFDTHATRPWRGLAGRRGLRILAGVPSHDPDPDVEVRECAS